MSLQTPLSADAPLQIPPAPAARISYPGGGTGTASEKRGSAWSRLHRKINDAADNFFYRLGCWVATHPKRTLLVSVALVIACCFGFANFVFANDGEHLKRARRSVGRALGVFRSRSFRELLCLSRYAFRQEGSGAEQDPTVVEFQKSTDTIGHSRSSTCRWYERILAFCESSSNNSNNDDDDVNASHALVPPRSDNQTPGEDLWVPADSLAKKQQAVVVEFFNDGEGWLRTAQEFKYRARAGLRVNGGWCVE